MLQNILRLFQVDSKPISCTPFGHGHINQTYRVITDDGKSYVLQHINQFVFKDPVGLMDNAGRVTSFIRQKGEPALHFLRTSDGTFCCQDEQGEYWRAYTYIAGFSLNIPECPEDFYQSALAFGRFQELLSDFPADTLFETIPNFHNTPDRYRQLKESIASDPLKRLSTCQEEVAFYLAQEEMASRLEALKQSGKLPLRVTHNDTKLNNVLLDNITRKPLCVLDLDTVMPGLSAYDFGDAIRFGATTAEEDEQDLSKVHFDEGLYRIYTRGFLEAAPSLTEEEINALPLGAFTMTVECGSRFLKDYLDGDVYFRAAYPTHNLVRARTQMKLASEMLAQSDHLVEATKQISQELLQSRPTHTR